MAIFWRKKTIYGCVALYHEKYETWERINFSQASPLVVYDINIEILMYIES